MPMNFGDRPTGRSLRDLARAMIAEAQMLKRAGERDLALDLGRRARAIDLLGWGFAEPAMVPARIRR